MIIDHDGNVIDAVYVDDNMRIFDCFRVRVLKEEFKNNRRVRVYCCGEEDYKEFPNEEALMYCIAKYKGDFANIEKIFTLVKLPFSE